MGHVITVAVPVLAALLFVLPVHGESASAVGDVFYQAHRGGLVEVPENTITAFRHAWSCPGAVPETDVCETSDKIMVCMHDDTPARTTNAPEPYCNKKIGEISYEDLRKWDAGIKFDPKYAGEKVPALTEVFDEMKGHPERQIYLDLKKVDLEKLGALIDSYGLSKQIIFVHALPSMCKKLQTVFPGARTMTWLSSTPEKIKDQFDKLAKNNFDGISQLQFHLGVKTTSPEIEYVFDDEYLKSAVARLKAANAVLQLRPEEFDAKSLHRLVALGVYWFVTDEPKRFSDTLRIAE